MTKNDNKKLKEIIDLACEEAKRLGNTKVSPEHLFLGMLRMDQARAIDVLIALGVDFYEVKAKIEQKTKSTIPTEESSKPGNILDIVGNRVEKSLADKKSALITFPKTEEGTYYAEVTYGNKQYQNEQFNFDQYSGEILKHQFYNDKKIGNGTALRARNYDLHMGSIFGLTGRILYLFAAMIAASLPITGFIIYLNRKKKKPKKKKVKVKPLSD